MSGVSDFQCTAKDCENRSPPDLPERIYERAVRAGWRIWGKNEPTLRSGEVRCPEHFDVPGQKAAR